MDLKTLQKNIPTINNKYQYVLVGYSNSYTPKYNNFILAKYEDVQNNDLNGYGVLWARTLKGAIEEIKKISIKDKNEKIIFKGSDIDILPYYKDVDINNNGLEHKYILIKNILVKK